MPTFKKQESREDNQIVIHNIHQVIHKKTEYFNLDNGHKTYLSGPNRSAIRCYHSNETVYIG